jgi:hypothetical protein
MLDYPSNISRKQFEHVKPISINVLRFKTQNNKINFYLKSPLTHVQNLQILRYNFMIINHIWSFTI